jgi:hypothetical protein
MGDDGGKLTVDLKIMKCLLGHCLQVICNSRSYWVIAKQEVQEQVT